MYNYSFNEVWDLTLIVCSKNSFCLSNFCMSTYKKY